jgi:hypothetical protein
MMRGPAKSSSGFDIRGCVVDKAELRRSETQFLFDETIISFLWLEKADGAGGEKFADARGEQTSDAGCAERVLIGTDAVAGGGQAGLFNALYMKGQRLSPHCNS